MNWLKGATAIALILLLVGCGSDDGGGGGSDVSNGGDTSHQTDTGVEDTGEADTAVMDTGQDTFVVHTVDLVLNDHQDGLTDQGGDNLFTLEHQDGDTLDMSRLDVTVQPEGEDIWYAMEIEVSDDADGDGAFSAGDTLLVHEPSTNFAGPAAAGSTFQVEVTYDIAGSDGGTVELLWNGTWTP